MGEKCVAEKVTNERFKKGQRKDCMEIKDFF